jgi:hypothetical protein
VFALPRLLGCVRGGDLGVDFGRVGREVPDSSADESQRSAGVVAYQAEQSIVGEFRLCGPSRLDRAHNFPYVGASDQGRSASRWVQAGT